MKFICLFDMKAGVTKEKVAEAIAKRSEYKFPEGSKLIAEYWTPGGSPSVISVIEASDPSQLMLNALTWVDVFDCRVLPVLDYQEGLQKLGKAFKK